MPLLSIVIPTKNRGKYVKKITQSILKLNDDRLELIIYDNSDSDDLKEYFKQLKDFRLGYYYDSRELAIVNNFNAAMQHVHGEYVCFIGDDDGVDSEIVTATEWLKKNDIDALIGNISVAYNWPKYENTGNLTIYPFSGEFEIVDLGKELQKFVQDGAVYYLKFNLPKVYHGIVRRECLEEIKKTTGTYFGGLTPDSYSSIAVANIAKKVVKIDYPITIAGSSEEADKTHRTDDAKHRKMQEAPHLKGRGNYTWTNEVPKIYSGETVWAESAIKALKDMGRNDLLAQIDKYKMSAHIIKKYPHYEGDIINNYFNKTKKPLIYAKLNWIKFRVTLKDIRKRVLNRLLKVISGKKTKHYNKISDIEHCINLLSKQFKSEKKNLSTCLSDTIFSKDN